MASSQFQAPLARQLAQRAGRALALFALALCLWTSAGCASLQGDVALAPLYTSISTAGGGREVEALAGIARRRQREFDGPLRDWSLRPFVKETLEENGDKHARFLVPLGSRKVSAFRYVWQLLLFARFERLIDETGHAKWSLVAIPATDWAEDRTERVTRAIFPLGGVIEGLLTFDRIEFALFPLYLRTVRDGQVSTSFLWPIFNWTNGPLGPSYRIWPLFGRVRQEGRFDRKFFLWPFFHWGRSFISSPNPESRWMFWPLYGHSSRGSFHAETLLWPFFGYSADSKTGFWAFDGPWPLVRFLRPGSNDPNGPRRSRIWPFWSSYEGDGLKSHWILFPLVNWTEEEDMLARRKSQFLVPIWQNWDRVDKQGVKSSWQKLWPLYQNYTDGAEGDGTRDRFAFPALNPLWRMPEIDDQYAWLYELVTREAEGERVSWRTWGNLFRRERDELEDRAYLSFLWSRRAYRAADEARVEHSLLFGLLRWRTYPDRGGFWPEPMAPAFPGPGWPMTRGEASQP